MLFYSFFKTLIGKTITVHLKNDVELTGTLLSVDQFLNLKLEEVAVGDEAKHPHLLALKVVFIRGSVVRYVEIPKEAVDCELLQDAARVEYMNPVASNTDNKGKNDEAGQAVEEGDGDGDETMDK